jgi:hypothetical protein
MKFSLTEKIYWPIRERRVPAACCAAADALMPLQGDAAMTTAKTRLSVFDQMVKFAAQCRYR